MPTMEMILLDWTRMGRLYCLAGVVADAAGYRVVRPLLVKHRAAPVRNVGWSPYLLDGHSRWEVFDLVGSEPPDPEPPHLEDLWVRALGPRRRTAPSAQRREILECTVPPADEPLFGVPLARTQHAAYLQPGTGRRSLVTLVVSPDAIRFEGSWRVGCPEPDLRVSLDLPDMGTRLIPVKDFHLLRRAEAAATDLNGRLSAMQEAIKAMGDPVAVRLGLSRTFVGRHDLGPGQCWLMADGFFSLMDPEP
jgi:hypothetical protein